MFILRFRRWCGCGDCGGGGGGVSHGGLSNGSGGGGCIGLYIAELKCLEKIAEISKKKRIQQKVNHHANVVCRNISYKCIIDFWQSKWNETNVNKMKRSLKNDYLGLFHCIIIFWDWNIFNFICGFISARGSAQTGVWYE